MTTSPYQVPLDALERSARTTQAEQVELQAEPRLHEPWLATPAVPAAGGGTGADADGD